MPEQKEIKCECCRRAKATIKDYRFIDSLGISGKVLVCKYCVELSDVDFSEEYEKEV